MESGNFALMNEMYKEILAMRRTINDLAKQVKANSLDIRANGSDIRALQVRNTLIDNVVAKELLKGEGMKQEKNEDKEKGGQKRHKDDHEHRSWCSEATGPEHFGKKQASKVECVEVSSDSSLKIHEIRKPLKKSTGTKKQPICISPTKYKSRMKSQMTPSPNRGKRPGREKYIRSRNVQGTVRTERMEFRVGPFIVRRPLDSEEEDYMFRHIIRDDVDEEDLEPIVRTSLNWLGRNQVRTLYPGIFIDAEIINIHAEWLTVKERRGNGPVRNWYFTTRLTNPNNDGTMVEASFLENLNMAQNFGGNMRDCHKIYLPVHHINHFFLLIFFLQEKKVEIWDSMLQYDGRSCGEHRVIEVMETLDFILAADMSKNSEHVWSFSDFKTVTRTDVPQQPNGFDCGLYVMGFMRHRAFEEMIGTKWDSHEERLRTIMGFASFPLNEMLGYLKNLAREAIRKDAAVKQKWEGSPTLDTVI